MTIKNPIIDGYYADPEARKFGDRYYIYVTGSNFKNNMDCFSSADLSHWEKHEGILCIEEFPKVHKCVWAPTAIEKNGKYYLVFAANDIKSDDQPGGLEIAVSDKPEGPYHAFTDTLVDKFHNGAQPIDAHLFEDDDGTIYLYYGGWRHCNVCRMNEEMNGLIPLFKDGPTLFHEITPMNYVEAPCMMKRNGLYYFMWSSGNWKNDTYCVYYTTAASPLGPFEGGEKILATQLPLAEGPGHHGYIYLEDTDEYLIVYHRRTPGSDLGVGANRTICIDRMPMQDDKILPVQMTKEWTL